MQLTSKGQVTIPNQYRQKYGLLPHTEVCFVEEDGRLYIMPAKAVLHVDESASRGQRIIERMRRAKTNHMTADEVMALTRGLDNE